ncbi:LPS export ABC transporter permease LptF [Pararhodobacter sp. SW119]|uniref:LPS export ABC transporter permease LptF n=1 Tax=Pararhodobacter sp. SW119 TaxID=2780075 RepID=UPI001ADF5290
MGRLDRYILSQLLWVFGFFSLVLVSVYWVNRAVRLFDRLISDGQPMIVFLEFTALSLPMLIRTVLPIAAFVAATYVTVQLIRASEVTVLQAAGVSPFRLARPVLIFGLIVAAFLMVLAHFLVPGARAQLAQRQAEIAENVTAGLLQDGVFHHPTEGITLYVAEITPDGVMRGVYLSDARTMAQRVDYTARTALIVPEQTGPKLVMIDGYAQMLGAQTGRLAVTTFADFTYDLSGLIGPAGRQRRIEELSTAELFAPTPDLLDETRATPAQVRFELVSRFVEPFTAVAAALIGFAALIAGGFNRLGAWKPIVLAVVTLALMQLLINAAAGQAMRSVALSWLGAVPIGLGILAGFVLLLRASGRQAKARAVAGPT